MKVKLNRDLCSGHARCAAVAPEYYRLDDTGFVVLDGVVEVPAELEAFARRGARACPERAIEIVE